MLDVEGSRVAARQVECEDRALIAGISSTSCSFYGCYLNVEPTAFQSLVNRSTFNLPVPGLRVLQNDHSASQELGALSDIDVR